MSKIDVIQVNNLSKYYQLGQFGTGTISHDLNRFAARIRGKEDPYAKVGVLNDRTSGGEKGQIVKALDNINFNINSGEVVGVIGKNGAGKSTLLKILSRVTYPSTGEVKMRGRIASLLEVGTGFHPEMTGRENVHMNGTLMGMRTSEINRKLDEIVEFAGVSKYIDTPVKRYSSGMTVRLGFAVAAFLESEILIIDEVLAVGDASFQKKATSKIGSISSKDEKTILFVSHNLNSVKSICTSAMLIEQGRLSLRGSTDDVIRSYLNEQKDMGLVNTSLLPQSKIDGFSINEIRVFGDGDPGMFSTGDNLNIQIDYEATKEFQDPSFVVQLKDDLGIEILRLSNMPISGYPIQIKGGKGTIELEINQLNLVEGTYFIDLGFVRERVEWYFKLENVIKLEIEGKDVYSSGMALDRTRGIIVNDHQWRHAIK